jgi:hypothetical protein
VVVVVLGLPVRKAIENDNEHEQRPMEKLDSFSILSILHRSPAIIDGGGLRR